MTPISTAVVNAKLNQGIALSILGRKSRFDDPRQWGIDVAQPWPDPTRLERRIRFYRITVRARDRDRPFNPVDVLDQLERLLVGDDRYLEHGERVTLCLPDRREPLPRMRIVDIRRRDLPQYELGGNLGPLPIDPDAGLADQIHLTFFPDGVVGSEFNFRGPRVSRLAEVVNGRRIGPRIDIRALFRDDAVRQVDEMQELRMARLRMRRGSGPLLRRVDEALADAFESTREFSADADVELVVRRQPRTRESLPDRVRRAFGVIATSDDGRHAARAIQLEGRNPASGEFEIVDLLEQDLVTTRRILRTDPGSRVLDSGDTYAAIESAYEELLTEIQRAGTLGPDDQE